MQVLLLNFKIVFFMLFIAAACGVKGPPVAPTGTEIPSLYQKYLTPTPSVTPTPIETVTTTPTVTATPSK